VKDGVFWRRPKPPIYRCELGKGWAENIKFHQRSKPILQCALGYS